MRKSALTIMALLAVLAVWVPAADASYVLPYPSAMPGNKVYRIGRVLDTLKGYWSFGSIAQAKYRLSLSDKYLVEAKTLFEYKQYLLAADALARSDAQFSAVLGNIKRARSEGKDVGGLETLQREAAGEHVAVLDRIMASTPPSFTWQPEHGTATGIGIHDAVAASRRMRAEFAGKD